MTITSGFFNSQNGDRKYSAEEMSSLFEGIITDGVFQNVGNSFSVSIYSTRTIRVGSGKAWLKNVWVNNSSLYAISIPAAPVSVNNKRIDAIVIDINKNSSYRSGNIALISGAEAPNPEKPTLITQGLHCQMPICYVTSRGGVDQLVPDDIEYVVGTEECPFITAPMASISMHDYLSLWEAKFNAWLAELENTLSLDPNTGVSLMIAITNVARMLPGNIRVGTTDPDSMASQLNENDVYIYIPD